MPLRNYKCIECKKTKSVIINPNNCFKGFCECGGEYIQLVVSEVLLPKVTEKVGKYWNKNIKEGIKEEMQERSKEHMRNHEMHDMIAKHGLKNLENHPLIKDGRIRKKGD